MSALHEKKERAQFINDNFTAKNIAAPSDDEIDDMFEASSLPIAETLGMVATSLNLAAQVFNPKTMNVKHNALDVAASATRIAKAANNVAKSAGAIENDVLLASSVLGLTNQLISTIKKEKAHLEKCAKLRDIHDEARDNLGQILSDIAREGGGIKQYVINYYERVLSSEKNPEEIARIEGIRDSLLQEINLAYDDAIDLEKSAVRESGANLTIAIDTRQMERVYEISKLITYSVSIINPPALGAAHAIDAAYAVASSKLKSRISNRAMDIHGKTFETSLDLKYDHEETAPPNEMSQRVKININLKPKEINLTSNLLKNKKGKLDKIFKELDGCSQYQINLPNPLHTSVNPIPPDSDKSQLLDLYKKHLENVDVLDEYIKKFGLHTNGKVPPQIENWQFLKRNIQFEAQTLQKRIENTLAKPIKKNMFGTVNETKYFKELILDFSHF